MAAIEVRCALFLYTWHGCFIHATRLPERFRNKLFGVSPSIGDCALEEGLDPTRPSRRGAAAASRAAEADRLRLRTGAAGAEGLRCMTFEELGARSKRALSLRRMSGNMPPSALAFS
mmetsp:Transcript_8484/g.20127  ORF Transcript_8484/g.20127 Transcript_8484/m.20127 type:complete len:117 (-) Transcript_8484:1182-1532(-)